MGGLRAITIGLVFGLSSAAVRGAPPSAAPSSPPASSQPSDSPATAGSTATTPAPNAAAADYLKAGAKLFNKGDIAQASKYLKAAQRYRDKLSKNERVVLDTYVEEVDRIAMDAARPRADTAVAPASMTVATPSAKVAGIRPADQAKPASPYPSRFATAPGKQRARWMLHEARDLIRRGKLDEAAQKVAEARAFDVEWGRFDDSPEKVTLGIEYARSKEAQTRSTPSARPLGIRPIDSPKSAPSSAREADYSPRS